MWIQLLLVSCLITFGSKTSAQETNKDSKIAQASNELAFGLLRQYKNEKNVLISPFSISTALAMVYLGASGHTSDTMRHVLLYEQYGLSEEDVHEAFRSVLNRVELNTADYQFSTFNDLLVQQNFNILQAYLHALQQYYSANIDSVDFVNHRQEIKERINAAVENSTRGKIKDFLNEPPSTDTVLFLLNAVYFLGNWKNPFNPDWSYESVFYSNGVTEDRVTMMHRIGEYQYARDTDLKSAVVVMPYKGDNSASMILVIPEERTGMEDLQDTITQGILNGILDNIRSRRIELVVPRFNLTYSADLVDALTTIGLGEVFSDRADLNRMAREQNQLRVSAIRHKAVIEVNERGSEAASATGVEIIGISLPETVKADHPFLFFIVEEQTRMILFAGKVDEL